MGEGEREKRAKQFKQKEDQVAMAEFQHEDLLSAKQAESITELDCELEDDSNFPPLGAKVLLLDRNQQRVSVFAGPAQIGWVDDGGTTLLREKFRIGQSKSRSLDAIVVDVSELTGRFTVRL
jgi:hypothetical protein